MEKKLYKISIKFGFSSNVAKQTGMSTNHLLQKVFKKVANLKSLHKAELENIDDLAGFDLQELKSYAN